MVIRLKEMMGKALCQSLIRVGRFSQGVFSGKVLRGVVAGLFAVWAELVYFLVDPKRGLPWLELSRNDPQARHELHSLRGRMYFELRRYQEAIEALLRAAELSPDNALYQAQLGRMLQKQGRWHEGRIFLERALSLDPGQATALLALAHICCHCEEGARAAELMDSYLVRKPGSAEGRELRARLYYEAGDFPKALSEMEIALRLTGRDSRIANGMAFFRERCLRPELRAKTRTGDSASTGTQEPESRFAVGVGAGIGNIVQCTPAIRRLAGYLGHPVDVIISEECRDCAPLLSGSEWVNRIYFYDRDLLRMRFGTVFLFHCFGGLAPEFNAEKVHTAQDHFALDLTSEIHEAEFNLMCMEKMLGIPYRREDSGAYFVGNVQRGLPVPGRIGVHAGCKGGKWVVKKWPYFEALADRLMAKGYKVVSVGSREEYVEGTENATGTDLATTLQTLSTCDYFMANDSGVMHLADALEIPLTAIFGPTSVVKNGPLSSGSQVIAVQKDCAPCQFKRDKFAACTCLREVELEEVEAKVLAHLNVWASGLKN